MNTFKIGFNHCFLFLIGLLLLSSCKDRYTEMIEGQKEADEKAIQSYITVNNIQNAQRQASGIYYVPITPGTGAQITRSSTVKIHYIGRYLDNQKFESTYDSGQPRNFVVGTSQIVPGLKEGLQQLKNGETATIIIPSHLGYGRYGYYPTIGPNEVLIYEISVLDVN